MPRLADYRVQQMATTVWESAMSGSFFRSRVADPLHCNTDQARSTAITTEKVDAQDPDLPPKRKSNSNEMMHVVDESG
jgi:hypothetical protein